MKQPNQYPIPNTDHRIKILITTSLILFISFIMVPCIHAKEYLKNSNDTTKGGKEITAKSKWSGTNSLLAGCAVPNGKNFLEFNNVKALIYTGGDMFWDFGTGKSSYEVPKGSGKHSMFLASLWLGGTDVNGQLRIAAQRYRSNGVDFYTGPLDTSGTAEVSPETCAEYDKHFIITRAEVDQFDAWFNDKESYPDYTIPKSILEWPAHGDASKGQSWFLAPFFDKNFDQFYDPYDGDYPFYDLSSNTECNRSRDREPKLFGDITYWYVFNDKGNAHNETSGDAIGLEVQAQEFAFATNDEINNMTFTNYRIINRSTFTLIDTYFGTNFDADLGFAFDDFVGCDVKRGLGYIYNGLSVDGTGAPDHYGANPPAIGVDFFEGPFQDPDGSDNPKDSACNAYINGSINGLNFGDGEVDNERWGMRRFVYYNNSSGVQGDPSIAAHYYNYLKGFWKDGTRMRYGGNGHINNCSNPPNCEYADFMFPGAKSNPQQTDECFWGVCNDPEGKNCGVTPADLNPWTEQQAGNIPDDRRFVHSAGPFVLEPGAENDITVGVVWERATSTDPFQSVELIRLADDKAQALFDNCFKVLNGPDAPQLTYQELNREIILYLSNPKVSNNYLEQYEEVDPLIILPTDYPGKPNGKIIDKKYRFQGYQVYQLKDATVSVSDVNDVEKARLVAQVDIKDSVAKLVNFVFDQSITAEVPTLMVNGNNQGIDHSFRVLEDLFAIGDKKLINHKKYYFLALAYAYNQYQIYNGYTDSLILNGNKKPYLAGRKSGFGGSIEAITCIPHIPEVEANGTEVNSKYGDNPVLTRVEGQGNGGLVLDLSQATVDAIMAGAPWRVNNITYQQNAGPISVKVVDPLTVKGGDYHIKFFYDPNDAMPITFIDFKPPITAGLGYFRVVNSGSLSIGEKFYVSGSAANDGIYTVFDITANGTKIFTEEWIPNGTVSGVINPYYKWALIKGTSGTDTVYVSDRGINARSEQIISSLGISVTVEQARNPGPAYAVPNTLTSNFPAKVGRLNPDPNNGFLEANMTFTDPGKPWLTGVFDGDAPNALNWIRSGTGITVPYADYTGIDDKSIFEKVLGGTWSPGGLCSGGFPLDTLGPVFAYKQNDRAALKYLGSIDLVITADKSKWTRSAVLELEENSAYTKPLGSNIPKLNLRTGKSVNKSGVPYGGNDTLPPSSDPNDANYIANTGMGWFPGYAINVETGERLNIVFGEDSWMINGNDMIWNPTSDLTDPLGQLGLDNGFGSVGCDPSTGDPCFPYWAGGKHYIYIIGHNGDDTTNLAQARGDIPAYDAGAYIRNYVMNGSPSDNQKMGLFKDVMWVGKPLLAAGYNFKDPANIPTTVKIRFRVAKPYRSNYSTDSVFAATPQNDNNPMYAFNLDAFETRTGVNDIAVDKLNNINVVPNPYFAFSDYETSQIDHRIKIINLPQKCTVKIYNLNGTLIRQFDRDDNSITSIDWDLKNSKNVPIASGVYIIHVNAPGIGEKIIKWFGVLRPIDLDSF